MSTRKSPRPAGRRPQGRNPQMQCHQPGDEGRMQPRPLTIDEAYRAAGKLEGKIVLITGGDSGIGRAVAVHFAREGASEEAAAKSSSRPLL